MLISVNSYDEKYKEDRSVYAIIEEVSLRGRPENRLTIYELKTKDLGKNNYKGSSVGYCFRHEIYTKFEKRRDKSVNELIIGERTIGNREYVVGGKIVFAKRFDPVELVVYIKTRGSDEIVSKSIPFPKSEFETVKGDPFNFELEVAKVEDLVTYVEANDAFYNEKLVCGVIEDGRYGSPITKTMLDGRILIIYEVSKIYIAHKNQRSVRRELGRVFNLLVNRSILQAKEKGENEVLLGKFEYQEYKIGGKFTFEDDYTLNELIIWIKPRGLNNSLIEKRVPFPTRQMFEEKKNSIFNLDEEMKKHEKICPFVLLYIRGDDALYFEKIIYLAVEDGEVSAARLGVGRHKDKRLVLYSMNRHEIGKKKGHRFGQIFSLQLKEKIQLVKKRGKGENEVKIGEFTDTKYKSGPCIWGGKVKFDDEGGKPVLIVVYYQGRGKDQSMREVSCDFGKFPSVEKDF